jgi:hypothetical protein
MLNKVSSQKVVTVDNYSWNPFGLTPKLHEIFTERILRGALATGELKLFKGSSTSFMESCVEIPAMLFIDAAHSYEAVSQEILWAKAKGVGIISGHDYGHPRFGVTRAVDEAFQNHEVTVIGSVWSVQYSKVNDVSLQ